MQNYCKTIGALAAASALAAGNASAGLDSLQYQLHTGYTNQYLFRGADLGDGLVEVGADVSTKYNGIGLSAGAWYGSYDQSIPFGGLSQNAAELDLYAGVSKDFGFVTLGAGFIYYYYEQGQVNSLIAGRHKSDSEVYVSASRDFGFLNASFTYYGELNNGGSTGFLYTGGDNDGYSELALTKSIPINACLGLDLSTNVSYLFENGEFGSWTSKATLNWAFAEHAKLSPFVAFSMGISNRNVYASDNSNELVGGSMLSVSF